MESRGNNNNRQDVHRFTSRANPITLNTLIRPSRNNRQARQLFANAVPTILSGFSDIRTNIPVLSYETSMEILVRRVRDETARDIRGGRGTRFNNDGLRYFQVNLDNFDAGDSLGNIGEYLRRRIVSRTEDYNEDDDDMLDYKFEIVRVGYTTRGRRFAGTDNLTRAQAPERDYLVDQGDYRVQPDYTEEEKAERRARRGDTRGSERAGADEEDTFDALRADEIDEKDFDFDEDDMLGLHQYKASPLEETFSMQPLHMPEFPCIYESLMVIKWFHQNEQETPDVTIPEWKLYVLMHFEAEDIHVQQMFYEGWIIKGIEYFRQRYNIDVGLFNACLYQEEIDRIEQLLTKEETAPLVPKYFLVYWSEHVFPCRVERLTDLAMMQHVYVKKINQENGDNKNFIMYPRILDIVHLEYKCSLFGRGYHTGDHHYLYEDLNMDRLHIFKIPFYLQGKRYKDYESQLKAQRDLNEHRHYSDEDTRMHAMQLLGEEKSEEELDKMENALLIMKNNSPSIYFTPRELQRYNEMMELFRLTITEESFAQDDIDSMRSKMAAASSVAKYSQHREQQFDKLGIATLDIETYMDSNKDRETVYNMVPFCATLFGRLEKKVQRVVVRKHGANRKTTTEINQFVELVDVNETFFGFHPRECLRKLIEFLMDGNFCYVQHDYKVLKEEKKEKPKRLTNYIFAHNGFGFDYKFLYEQLLQNMKEFNIVGDITQTKALRGNGLHFLDFSLIYREKLADLARTFFPQQYDMHKFDCDLVINLQKDTLKGWFDSCERDRIPLQQHPQIGEIARYCMQDSRVLYEIVTKFFRKAYSTPYGYGFLPKPFYHSLSAMAYEMFTQCYLKKAIFVNRHTLDIEQATKLGGCTGANSNCFGFGIFIDENSFYPAVMQNEMPVEYELGGGDHSVNPFEIFSNGPFILTAATRAQFDLRPYNIYCVSYRFPEGTVLPTIEVRTRDTMVMVLESDDYDSGNDIATAHTVYLYGYELIVAIEEVEGTEIKIFGQIRFRAGDFVFRDFILDQYNMRLRCKELGDMVGDKFHKNIMNSAEGKVGENSYDNVMFGSAASIKDAVSMMQMREDVENFEVKQILSDEVDLFELRWRTKNDKWLQAGNTVRIPAYIMAVARSQLMRIQTSVARLYANPDVVAYYDTDSVLIRFDLNNPDTNAQIQNKFDVVLEMEKSLTVMSDLQRCYSVWLKNRVIQEIGALITRTRQMEQLEELEIEDVCKIHESGRKARLLDNDRLGACKIEKYVIRGIALGAKEYGVYYLDYNSKKRQWNLQIAVRLKGVRPNARRMDMVEGISERLISYRLRGDITQLPMAVTPLMTKWSRMGAGVILTDMVKVIRPTLTKRAHNLLDGTSRPYRTVGEFQLAKNAYMEESNRMKAQFKDTFTDLAEELQERPEFIALQDATQLENRLRLETENFFKDAVSKLAESRKRYMIRLSRIKYDQLQDRVLDLLLGDRRIELWRLASEHLPKLEVIALHAVSVRRQQSKRGMYTMRDETMEFTDRDAARVVAYMLFIFYILNNVFAFTDIPENFNTVCENLSDQFIYQLLQLKPPEREQNLQMRIKRAANEEIRETFKHLRKWNYSIVFGYEFLQAGLCIYKRGSESSGCDATLKEEMKYTTLWRFLNNLQNHLAKVRINRDELNLQELEHDFAIDAVIVREDMRGPITSHHLLVNRIEEDDRFIENYDIVNLNRRDEVEELINVVEPKRREVEEKFIKEIDGTFVQPAIFSKVRKMPAYEMDTRMLKELNEAGELMEKQTETRIAQILMMSKRVKEQSEEADVEMVDMEQMNLGHIYTRLQERFGLARFDRAFFQQVYRLSTANNPHANKNIADDKDLVDMCTFLLFLHAGGLKAAMLMRTLHLELENMMKKEKAYHRKFIRVCRTIFCNEQMFNVIAKMDRLSAKTHEMIRRFSEITIYLDAVTIASDDAFHRRLNDIINDKALIAPQLAELDRVLESDEQLIVLGERVFHRIYRWRNPSREDLHILKSILLLQRNVYGDNSEQIEALVNNEIEEFVDNMEHTFANVQMLEEEEKENLLELSWPDLNNGGEDDYDVKQYQRWQDDPFAESFPAAASEDSAAVLNIENFLRQDAEENMDVDEQSSVDYSELVRQGEKRRKTLFGSKFFDMEAVEDSEEESSQIICTSTNKRRRNH